MGTQLVADISEHQGAVNMARMARQVDGVILRAGYRGYGSGKLGTDARFSANLKAAIGAGIPVGVYWYTTACSQGEAVEEAEYLCGLLDGCKLDYPVFLDLEFAPKRAGRADQLTAAARTTYALAFLQRMEQAGYAVGIYCNQDFWRESLDRSRLADKARWIARYGSVCDVDCDLWQYTSTAPGEDYGVSSKGIDLSHCYTDFPAGTVSKFAVEAAEIQPEVTHDMDQLCQGDRGQQVRVLQILLNAALDSGLDVDGIFGAKTESAAKRYQNKRKLSVDGIVGPETWGKLLE